MLRDPEGYWTGFSARMRVIAYNTKLVSADEAPQSVLDLADPKWKGQAAIADPRFGSTSFHVAALYAVLGDEKADDFFRRLKANDVRIVDGNSVVRDMVVRGEVKVGLTDTDDVNVALEAGQPIAMVLPDRDGHGRAGDAEHGVARPRRASCRGGAETDRLPAVARSRTDAGAVGCGADSVARRRCRSEEHPGHLVVQADDARLRRGGELVSRR